MLWQRERKNYLIYQFCINNDTITLSVFFRKHHESKRT